MGRRGRRGQSPTPAEAEFADSWELSRRPGASGAARFGGRQWAGSGQVRGLFIARVATEADEIALRPMTLLPLFACNSSLFWPLGSDAKPCNFRYDKVIALTSGAYSAYLRGLGWRRPTTILGRPKIGPGSAGVDLNKRRCSFPGPAPAVWNVPPADGLFPPASGALPRLARHHRGKCRPGRLCLGGTEGCQRDRRQLRKELKERLGAPFGYLALDHDVDPAGDRLDD